MITLRVVFALSSIAVVLAGRGWWDPSPVPVHATGVTLEWQAPLDPLDEWPLRPERGAPAQRDRWGNEIERALGEYRIDPRGGLYERHAPETEVPRLGPPVL